MIQVFADEYCEPSGGTLEDVELAPLNDTLLFLGIVGASRVQTIGALHWLRDTCYREDNSTVRTRSGPWVLASLRNLAIGALRLAGRRDITEATGGPAAT